MPVKLNLSPAVRLLMEIGPSNLKNLAKWLDENRSHDEQVLLEPWIPDEGLWYIEVQDQRMYAQATNRDERIDANHRIFFTVNVFSGEIVWCNSEKKGNCGVRSQRWLQRLKKKFPDIVPNTVWSTHKNAPPPDGHYYDYRPKRKKKSA